MTQSNPLKKTSNGLPLAFWRDFMIVAVIQMIAAIPFLPVVWELISPNKPISYGAFWGSLGGALIGAIFSGFISAVTIYAMGKQSIWKDIIACGAPCIIYRLMQTGKLDFSILAPAVIYGVIGAAALRLFRQRIFRQSKLA